MRIIEHAAMHCQFCGGETAIFYDRRGTGHQSQSDPRGWMLFAQVNPMRERECCGCVFPVSLLRKIR
jgi:hypothetical protein